MRVVTMEAISSAGVESICSDKKRLAYSDFDLVMASISPPDRCVE